MRFDPNLTNPTQLCDSKGQPLDNIGSLKVGDTVYKQVGDRLMPAKVVQLNPFVVRST